MANEQPNSRRSGPPAPSIPPSQRDLAFKTFGVLDDGRQGKASVITSLLVNGSILLILVLVSLTAKKIVKTTKLTELAAPVDIKKEPPPEPKPPPPILKPPPPVPEVKLEPKIKVPEIEVPEPPKIQPVIMKPAPVPVITPPAPKAVTPPPAPKPVAVNIAQAASVANNQQQSSAIRLGSMTNPINNTSGPAVSAVNLGRSGAPGMNAANSGLGPASKISIGGSGSPNGAIGGHDNAAQPIKGIALGAPGGTGPMTAKAVGAIAIAKNNAPVPAAAAVVSGPAKTPPKLLYKPKPDYTDEARQLKIEGTVYVKIHVTAAGAVQVVGVSSGLGHGLDQSAIRAVQGMRFQPATQNGQPTDWDGVVNINFQLAG